MTSFRCPICQGELAGGSQLQRAQIKSTIFVDKFHSFSVSLLEMKNLDRLLKVRIIFTA